ncbi:hypothetical protein BCR42DRAFT_424121 [Absidia repens]|uniref:C2H2-type domain-containing protein n=1 Tax=Absidia repens TaxID=90262 RepID=A0A1X2I4P1_9FUNG|nr:hypothetical protein BCR42DRAFT_424121 [Absidia repens]
MPLSKKRTYQRHSEPKLFQCTGFGDCKMVFTRSEHLARHARKHTGEKPFKCVVPGCERAFSRFDNMIQHTSTHNKKGGDRKNMQCKKHSNSKQKFKEMNVNKGDSVSGSQQLIPLITTPVDMGYSAPHPSSLSLPVSPISDMDSPCHQRLPSISDSYFQHSPTNTTNTGASMDYFSHINTPGAIPSMHPTYLPSPKELLFHHMPIYPLKSTTTTDEYDHTADGGDHLSSISSPTPSSPASTSSSPMSPPLPQPESLLSPPSSSAFFNDGLSRRLSNVELALPIQELSVCHGTGTKGINITCDEFEALQAFSQLSSSSSVGTFPNATGGFRSRSMSLNTGAMQVNAFRQQLALAHESCSRMSPRSII